MSDDVERTGTESLSLLNYRKFADLRVDFDPELTVLVASNGGGKTAVLEALVAAWSSFVAALSANGSHVSVRRTDVRRVVSPDHTTEPVLPTRIAMTALLAGTPHAWGEQLDSVGPKAVPMPLGDGVERATARRLRDEVMSYTARKRSHPPVLPLLAYQGARRGWRSRKLRSFDAAEEEADTSRFSGYTDCLSSASTFQHFETWFRRFSYEAQSEISSGRASPHKPIERLQAVSVPVSQVLAPSGWRQLEWDFAEDTLVASHPDHGRLPVRLLSDGIRNMIGLVGDIAHRAVRLNPHFGAAAASRTPGVVLIDEVDMHLHPEWQQTVVPSLREAFPAMQIIVTTHSPLVISTVPSRCIRILRDDGSVSVPSAETEGYDSPFALGTVFGVDVRPPGEFGRQLTRYRALVEQGEGDSEEGASLRASLLEHFGAGHPAMLEAEGLRRLHAFKARIGAARGAG